MIKVYSKTDDVSTYIYLHASFYMFSCVWIRHCSAPLFLREILRPWEVMSLVEGHTQLMNATTLLQTWDCLDPDPRSSAFHSTDFQ